MNIFIFKISIFFKIFIANMKVFYVVLEKKSKIFPRGNANTKNYWIFMKSPLKKTKIFVYALRTR